MESDADRLDSIRALGGQPVTHARGVFFAIFERAYAAIGLADLDIESRDPALMCRASDVTGLTKGETLTVAGQAYRLARAEPDAPAPGWSTLVLRA